jgi:hypothetical protein
MIEKILRLIKKFLKFIGLYLLNILLGLDKLGNALTFGDPDEYISARVGRRWPNSVAAKVINALFFWSPNHVARAYLNEQTAIIGDEDLIK